MNTTTYANTARHLLLLSAVASSACVAKVDLNPAPEEDDPTEGDRDDTEGSAPGSDPSGPGEPGKGGTSGAVPPDAPNSEVTGAPDPTDATDGNTDGPPTPLVEELCRAACDRVAACDSENTVSECMAGCMADGYETLRDASECFGAWQTALTCVAQTQDCADECEPEFEAVSACVGDDDCGFGGGGDVEGTSCEAFVQCDGLDGTVECDEAGCICYEGPERIETGSCMPPEGSCVWLEQGDETAFLESCCGWVFDAP